MNMGPDDHKTVDYEQLLADGSEEKLAEFLLPLFLYIYGINGARRRPVGYEDICRWFPATRAEFIYDKVTHAWFYDKYLVGVASDPEATYQVKDPRYFRLAEAGCRFLDQRGYSERYI